MTISPGRTGVTTYSTPSDLEIVAVRIVDAPRRIAWKAWTQPKHVQSWLLGPEGWTMPVCEIDLRVSGAWRFVWRHEDGRELEMSAPS
ncbi:MAG: SRPBCC domain-containing protein [bacterium]